MIMSTFNFAAQLRWDFGIRGVLVVLVGIAVLMGSTYLLLSTNVGARVGILVAVAGLSGWLMLMGLVWATYGIGYKGAAPHWTLKEMVVSSSADDLSAAALTKAHDLSTWKALAADDPHRGDAAAAATAILIAPGSPAEDLYKGVDTNFKVLDAYETGGKTKSFFNNWFPGPHPEHYSIVQVAAVKEVEVPLGTPPPLSEADPSKPVVSVVMIRDLGKLRLPSVTLAVFSAVIFGVTCNALHRRDKAVMAARAAAASAAS